MANESSNQVSTIQFNIHILLKPLSSAGVRMKLVSTVIYSAQAIVKKSKIVLMREIEQFDVCRTQ